MAEEIWDVLSSKRFGASLPVHYVGQYQVWQHDDLI
jgi:hypothetical protein